MEELLLMRKNIRKSVVVLLASLTMVPTLTACENNDITTSKGSNSQTETVDNLGQKRKYSKQNNHFAYYSMPSVLKVASLANSKSFYGISGIAVDPDTRAEYYFAITPSINRKTGIVTIVSRKTGKGIVSYHGDLSKLKTVNILNE
jgi:hypothetical protein